MTLESADFRIRFPELLRRSRQDAQLSIRQLARRAGIDPTHLSRMERGLVPAPAGARLAAVVRELPSSALAEEIQKWSSKMLKGSALESAERTLQLLLGVSREDLADSAWNARVAKVLKTCLKIMESRGKRE